jgi:phage shock protein PspC (stress-responsive transcriptional regulator)
VPEAIAKCFCQSCNGPIEFPSEGVGQVLECPHCKRPTVLGSAGPPPIVQTASRGVVIDYSVQTGTGVISGDSGGRYGFSGSDWKSSHALPNRGTRVDFIHLNGKATDIYEIGSDHQAGSTTGYRGLYRSSDDNVLGGVCAGLAHKWQSGKTGIRCAFVLLGLVYCFGVIAYAVLWMVAKPLPTKGV